MHFTGYGDDELFVGGAAATAEHPDVIDAVNVRFHSYPPTDFAVGGNLLSRRVPTPARWAKRLRD